MNNRYPSTLTVLLCFTSFTQGQSTPPLEGEHPSPSIISVRDEECDTVDFEGLPSNTTVTDQYLACGALFLNSVTNDYGPGTYGSTLHSTGWYDPLEVLFVDPADGVTPRPVQYVSFENIVDPVISGETDYITVSCYDASNQLVAWTWNTSASRVEIQLVAPLITRVVIDDTMNTAYALDDFVFDGVMPTGIAPVDDADMLTTFPNPLNDVLHVRSAAGSATKPLFIITDVNGRELLRPVALAEAGGWRLDLHALAAGPYLLRMVGHDGVRTRGLIKQ